MISLPSDITPQDLNQWVEGGWFFYKTKSGELTPAMMDLYPSPTEKHYVVRLVGGATDRSADLDRIKPHWPVCGALNIVQSKSAVYIERLQKKQFCRTYNYRLVRMTVPGRTLLGGHEVGNLHPSSDFLVAQLFNPEYFPLDDIVKRKFTDGWASCAVSPTVIILKQRPRHLIFYRGELAGYVGEGNKLEDVDATMVPKLLKHLGGDTYYI